MAWAYDLGLSNAAGAPVSAAGSHITAPPSPPPHWLTTKVLTGVAALPPGITTRSVHTVVRLTADVAAADAETRLTPGSPWVTIESVTGPGAAQACAAGGVWSHTMPHLPAGHSCDIVATLRVATPAWQAEPFALLSVVTVAQPRVGSCGVQRCAATPVAASVDAGELTATAALAEVAAAVDRRLVSAAVRNAADSLRCGDSVSSRMALEAALPTLYTAQAERDVRRLLRAIRVTTGNLSAFLRRPAATKTCSPRRAMLCSARTWRRALLSAARAVPPRRGGRRGRGRVSRLPAAHNNNKQNATPAAAAATQPEKMNSRSSRRKEAARATAGI